MKLSLDINTDFEVTTLTDLPKLKNCYGELKHENKQK